VAEALDDGRLIIYGYRADDNSGFATVVEKQLSIIAVVVFVPTTCVEHVLSECFNTLF
jgi:hypothetical protein